MFVRRRRPLMRAAMVGGTAYAGKKMQEGRAAAPAPTTAPASPGAISSEAMAQLKLLAELKDSGVLTEEEFEVQKHRLMGTS